MRWGKPQHLSVQQRQSFERLGSFLAVVVYFFSKKKMKKWKSENWLFIFRGQKHRIRGPQKRSRAQLLASCAALEFVLEALTCPCVYVYVCIYYIKTRCWCWLSLCCIWVRQILRFLSKPSSALIWSWTQCVRNICLSCQGGILCVVRKVHKVI